MSSIRVNFVNHASHEVNTPGSTRSPSSGHAHGVDRDVRLEVGAHELFKVATLVSAEFHVLAI